MKSFGSRNEVQIQKAFAEQRERAGVAYTEDWIPIQGTTDISKIVMHILYTHEAITNSKAQPIALGRLIGKNQNPHYGGDGTMSIPQLEAAREFSKALNDLEEAYTKFMSAPAHPTLREGDISAVNPTKDPISLLYHDDDIPF